MLVSPEGAPGCRLLSQSSIATRNSYRLRQVACLTSSRKGVKPPPASLRHSATCAAPTARPPAVPHPLPVTRSPRQSERLSANAQEAQPAAGHGSPHAARRHLQRYVPLAQRYLCWARAALHRPASERRKAGRAPPARYSYRECG